jgi:flavin-dependent dehydrogenase
MTDHDVIIIGGSLAGAACARELERLGIDAIALERDRFPRAKVCGGFVSPGAVKCLERLGSLAQVRKTGAVEVTSARVRVESVNVKIPFRRAGLGISRSALDDVVARGARVKQGCAVCEVRREDGAFHVDGMACSVVIDAAGKLSRFSRRRSVEEFGIQYLQSGTLGGVLDFSFFEDGYGGTVSIEGGRSNSCFLIKKDALAKYLDREDCLVTGPLAYERVPGEFIAIGDAAGMVDPFCGEGMRHALETGILAARVAARGIRRRASYEEMKWEYEAEWTRRWAARRTIGAMIRRLLRHRELFAGALRFTPTWVLNRMWD